MLTDIILDHKVNMQMLMQCFRRVEFFNRGNSHVTLPATDNRATNFRKKSDKIAVEVTRGFQKFVTTFHE